MDAPVTVKRAGRAGHEGAAHPIAITTPFSKDHFLVASHKTRNARAGMGGGLMPAAMTRHGSRQTDKPKSTALLGDVPAGCAALGSRRSASRSRTGGVQHLCCRALRCRENARQDPAPPHRCRSEKFFIHTPRVIAAPPTDASVNRPGLGRRFVWKSAEFRRRIRTVIAFFAPQFSGGSSKG